jgi:uncharacterized membrane protein
VLERILPGAAHLQNLHPLFVHFPIAFLFGAALLYFAAAVRASELLAWAALWMLAMGAVGAAASLATGLYAASGVMVSESVRGELLRRHEYIMIVVSCLTFALALWALAARPMPSRARPVFLAGLLALVCLIAAGADLGGQMVYDYNAGGNACAQPIDYRK